MKRNVSLKLFLLWEVPTNTEYKNKVLVYISVEKYLIFFTKSHGSPSVLEISFAPHLLKLYYADRYRMMY